ncbi:MAG: multidrug transporter MatE, partial [Oscillospiraceae bacterium]|nr:multidrug transporter MatE [Oscillospiraceae bacterium]
MDLLRDNPKKMYFRFLAAAFGATLISCVYSVVDSAMVGQYQGPLGTAALAIVSPVFNAIFSLGLLTGIGGSVIFSTLRGESEKNRDLSNEYFTTSVILSAFFALLIFSAVMFAETPLLRLFGGDEVLIPLAHEYLMPIKFAIPFYIFSCMLSAFLRNDGSPGLAMAATLSSGLFNVVADYLLVFPLGLGLFGAGLATALGSLVSIAIIMSHFFKKRNTLRLVLPKRLFSKISKIVKTGFSTFFVDIAMGILTI